MEERVEGTPPTKPWARKVSVCILPGILIIMAIAGLSSKDELAQRGAAVVLLVPLAVIYFIPAYLAHKRHHENASAITVLNIFLGWTFLGWVAALVWSFTKSGDVRAE